MQTGLIRQLLDRSDSIARGVISDLKQLLAPPLCIGCDGDLPEDDPIFCRSCLESLRSMSPEVLPICPFCGRHEFKNENCRFCGGGKSKMRLYYWVPYADELMTYILSFKYHGVLELGIRLTDEALIRLSEPLKINAYDYIIPVPLHRRRLRSREYNQSEIIAGRLADALGIEQLPDSILRVRSTTQQAKIYTEERRWKNVENAFRLSPHSGIDFSGKRILIVDDIVTTGATVFETSRPIRQENPEIIDVFSLAYAG